MPSGDARWTELSSENERVVKPDDPPQSRWSELGSSSERLVAGSDPLLPAPRGSQARGGLQNVSMRHAAGAA